MEMRLARAEDVAWLQSVDRHVGEAELRSLVALGRVYVAERDGERIGWLRYNLFWDNTPFMNLLYFLEPFRRQGLGRALVTRWEDDMRTQGYETVLTSSQSDEDAQHFYRKLGYRDVGALLLPGEPLEVFFLKTL